MIDINQRDSENSFEYKLRLCKAKKNQEIDLSWSEIVEKLKLDISPDHLRKTACGLIEYDNYLKNHTVAHRRILAISDLHIPFQLPVETFEQYKNQIDVLVLNGDINDFQSISKFRKVYRINPMQEIIQARQYIIQLIEYLNPKQVYVNKGNHDQRFQNYLAKNLDTDLLSLMPGTQLDLILKDGLTYYDKANHNKTYYEPIADIFHSRGIEIIYNDDWKCKIGKAWFLHPLAFSKSTLKTSENAMNYLHKIDAEPFDTVVLGHTHKIGYTKLGQVHLYEQGSCCKTEKLNYMDGKLTDPQQKGYLFLCQDKDGNIIKDKTNLISLD